MGRVIGIQKYMKNSMIIAPCHIQFNNYFDYALHFNILVGMTSV